MSRIRGNVLIVEDDMQCGEMILHLLVKASYGVRWAQSREQANFAMLCHDFDYLLVDYGMSGTPVKEFVATCRIHTDNIILISEGPNARNHAKRLNISHWLAKPFSPERLMEVMRGLSSGVQQGIARV